MKKLSLVFILTFLSGVLPRLSYAQVPVKIESGMIRINDGSFKTDPQKYALVADSLDKVLKINGKDTTALFSRAMIYLSFNDLLAKPFQGTKGALENLVIAKDLAEKAITLKMQNFNLKVLRAQIYSELTYRFTGDESWKYNAKQIVERKSQFNAYKERANTYYSELMEIDKPNAYDYEKLKVTTKYPL